MNNLTINQIKHSACTVNQFSYVVPVVQSRQVYSTLRIDMFTLPDDHAGSGSQEADGRREGKGIQEPQQDGQVIWVSCECIIINKDSVQINIKKTLPSNYKWAIISIILLVQLNNRFSFMESHLDIRLGCFQPVWVDPSVNCH